MNKPGDRVELIHTTDEHTRLRPGARGTVRIIDGAGTIHVRWDDGHHLGLIPGEDTWATIDQDATGAANCVGSSDE